MKKFVFILVLFVAAASYSFTTDALVSANLSDIQFKMRNDTGAQVDYVINSEHLILEAGQSRGFSYPAGTVVYHWTDGQQGAVWFTIGESMHGHSYNASDMTQPIH